MKIFLSLSVFFLSFSASAQALRKEAIQSVQVSKVNLIQPGMYGGTDTVKTDKGELKFNSTSSSLAASFTGPLRGVIEDHGAFPGQFGGVWFNPIVKKTAKISFCANGLMGCADQLSISGQKILLTPYDTATKSKIEGGRASGSTKNVTVEGYYISERGHMPNPMNMVDVFVVTSIEFSAQQPAVNNSDRSVSSKIPGLAEDSPTPAGASAQ